MILRLIHGHTMCEILTKLIVVYCRQNLKTNSSFTNVYLHIWVKQ